MDAYECHAFYQSQQFQLSTAGLWEPQLSIYSENFVI
jgi:hypothetical protein